MVLETGDRHLGANALDDDASDDDDTQACFGECFDTVAHADWLRRLGLRAVDSYVTSAARGRGEGAAAVEAYR